MKAIYLIWYRFYANDGERQYVMKNLSWKRVLHVFQRLDGNAHPSFNLYFREFPHKYPQLLVIGGGGAYAISLVFGSEENGSTKEFTSYINPDMEQNKDRATQLRGVGKGYHNYEIEEMFFLKDEQQTINLINYIAHTGEWHPAFPFQRKNFKY